ncbi:alpha/beta fold hydrolase [Pelagicoccus albus]|uniref:Alpha/beta fold hydrolase n=1 Tax=Pelagicoccus albus TaxID=415222 RepID=A0A7X1B8Y7_9BACT|nr:alpha/beta fold hydrolase [Pelagicoccus albus]
MDEREPLVVLLHGLARTSRSMRPMAKYLERHGFNTLCLSYPSTKAPVEKLAGQVRSAIRDQCGGRRLLHFVTHSMGGILLRVMQRDEPMPNLGRAVMLCPPNKGSQIVDRLGGWRLFGWLNGPAGRQLVTGPLGLPETLGKANFEVGVLAGNRTFDPILSRLLPGENDGKVAVSHMELEGQADFKIVPATHTFVMSNGEAQANTLAFLKNGAFIHP